MSFKGILLLAMTGALGAGITGLIMWLRFFRAKARMKRILKPIEDTVKVWPCPGDTLVIHTREKIPDDDFKILVAAIKEFVQHDQFTVLNLLNGQSLESMSKEDLQELVVQKHVHEEVEPGDEWDAGGLHWHRADGSIISCFAGTGEDEGKRFVLYRPGDERERFASLADAKKAADTKQPKVLMDGPWVSRDDGSSWTHTGTGATIEVKVSESGHEAATLNPVHYGSGLAYGGLEYAIKDYEKQYRERDEEFTRKLNETEWVKHGSSTYINHDLGHMIHQTYPGEWVAWSRGASCSFDTLEEAKKWSAQAVESDTVQKNDWHHSGWDGVNNPENPDTWWLQETGALIAQIVKPGSVVYRVFLRNGVQRDHKTLELAKHDGEKKRWRKYDNGVFVNHGDGRMIEPGKPERDGAVQYTTYVRAGAHGKHWGLDHAMNYVGDEFSPGKGWQSCRETWWHPETGALIKSGPGSKKNRQYRLYRDGKTHDYERLSWAKRDGQLEVETKSDGQVDLPSGAEAVC